MDRKRVLTGDVIIDLLIAISRIGRFPYGIHYPLFHSRRFHRGCGFGFGDSPNGLCCDIRQNSEDLF